MAKSIERTHGEIDEIKENIEKKNIEADDLEKTKEAYHAARAEIESSNMSDELKSKALKELDKVYEETKEKGEALAEETQEDTEQLERIKQDAQEAIKDATDEKNSLENKLKLFERFGLGSGIEDTISEVDEEISEQQNIVDRVIEREKEINEVVNRLRRHI